MHKATIRRELHQKPHCIPESAKHDSSQCQLCLMSRADSPICRLVQSLLLYSHLCLNRLSKLPHAADVMMQGNATTDKREG